MKFGIVIHMNKKWFLFLLVALLVALANSVLAQDRSRGSQRGETLSWTGVTKLSVSSETGISVLHFEGADYHLSEHNNPVFHIQRSVNGVPARASASLIDTEFEPLSSEERNAVDEEALSEEIEPEAVIGLARGKAYLSVQFVPLRKNAQTGMIEKLVSFRLESNVSGSMGTGDRSARTTSSVMASGDWYRIGVSEDGVYRINYDFLESAGVDVQSLQPDQINIYGNGSGLLPIQNSEPRFDDLQPNAIRVVGGEDGSFDSGDYILFYAKGPHRWNYSEPLEEFRHVKHLYTDTSFYFIGIDVGAPKRMNTVSSSTAPATHNVTSFDDYSFYEIDQVNLIKSGRTWYGETFDIQNSYTFSGSKFSFPNIRTDELAKVRFDFIARTVGLNVSSTFNVNVNNGEATEAVSVESVSGNYIYAYAEPESARLDFNPGTSDFNIQIDFVPYNSSSKGWLNYISMNVRRGLTMTGNQMQFRDVNSVGPGNVADFVISGASAVRHLWDVTDPTNVAAVDYGPNTSTISFRRAADELRNYIAFSEFSFPEPTFFGPISNQNLHALGVQQPIDMVIVTHPRFYAEAMDLADFHTNHPVDPVYCEVVTNQQVYNEFSSGMPDITAIKDLMRMLYDRAEGDEELMPKYLLLFGDGSYDNRSRSANNTNFILTYQSANSYSPTGSYVSDDYFGLLDFNEGDSETDHIDIGVGRLPVKTKQEAQDVLRKIKHYMTSDFSTEVAHCSGIGSSVFGEWRNRLVFIGDDGDSRIHMNQANQLAGIVEEDYPDYNNIKIFLDAYQKEALPGGNRYPEVNQLIKDNVERGALIVNYVGHGGEVGWAEERILDVSTIRNWTNFNAMPLFMTATCEFTRFDDPGRTSAGEYVLLNPNGAGVSLVSTTRLVFSGENFNLAKQFFDNVLAKDEVPDLRLGDISRRTKVQTSGSINKRSFMLIGDPAVRLSYPEMKVFTQSITDTLGNPLDTLKALGNVKVTGYVGNEDGVTLTDFNGVVTVTVYDKESEITTLANDGGTPFEFKTHKNVIYRGKAGVENGQFDFSFIVPKDINLSVDSTGRLSYYALSDETDAHGHKNGLTVGSIDENAAIDETGPQVELFMNDENFVLGGMTDENPVIFAKLLDNSGINMVGTGIGHDLSATLNDNSSQQLILNDFYESDLDTYKSGTVRYQLENMEEGLHKLRLKAWDVHNNSGEGYTEFVVAESEEFALSHILNYPNPFTTYTEFSFEHNQVCAFLNVQIQVFTISGKLVKTINTISNTNGFRVEPIAWNGLDDYGDQLARGVYVYKVKVRNPAGEKVEKFEKLVILK